MSPTSSLAQTSTIGQKQISCYYAHSLAAKSDGTVWAWGNNDSGQLGNGGYVFSQSPVQVSGVAGVTKVAVGGMHSLAMTNTGNVYSWGDNSSGQLGAGGANPIQANLVASGMVDIAAGYAHSVAVDSNGEVWLWGANEGLQLGTTVYSTGAPFKYPGLINAISCAAGDAHTLVLKSDGTVWACGSNGYGQTTNSDPAFAQVQGLPEIASIAAGTNHSCALASNGSVWIWGYSQTGNGADSASYPVQVSGLSNIVAVYSGGSRNIAVKADGTVVQWGVVPVLGIVTHPQEISGINAPLAMAVGYFHSLSASPSGTVFGWGFNGCGLTGFLSMSSIGFSIADLIGYYSGELVHGHTIELTGLEDVRSIAQSPASTVLVKGDGSVWRWGSNQYGAVAPGHVETPSPALMSGTGLANYVVASNSHYLILNRDGHVHAWGYNGSGQLGIGNTNPKASPFLVSGISDVVAVAAGDSNSVALKANGTVWWWGQMGDSSIGESSLIPIQASALGSANIAIAAGTGFGVALRTDGTVWAWGKNQAGQLGNGTYANSLVPVQVQIPSDKVVVQISTGSAHVLCRTSDGKVYGWGWNNGAKLDNSLGSTVNVPSELTSIQNVKKVHAGEFYSYAILENGNLVRWGGDSYPEQIAIVAENGTADVYARVDTYILKSDGTLGVSGRAMSVSETIQGHLSEGINPWLASPKPVLGFNLLSQAPLLTRSSPVGNTTVLPLGSTLQLEYLWNTASSSSRSLTLSHYGRELSTVSGVNPVLSFTPTTWGSFPLNVYGKDSNGAYSIRSSAGTVVVPYDSEYPNGDGLPDWWEILHIGNLSQNGSDSSDGDTLSNKWEFLLKSNPNLQDTDGDGVPDDRDSRPNDPAHGQLNISITFPVNGTQVP